MAPLGSTNLVSLVMPNVRSLPLDSVMVTSSAATAFTLPTNSVAFPPFFFFSPAPAKLSRQTASMSIAIPSARFMVSGPR